MRRADNALSSTALMLLGLAIALYANDFGLGALEEPGAGFMPFLAGGAILLSAAVGLIEAFRSDQADGEPTWGGGGWKPQALVLAMVFAFGVLLEDVGFLLCSFLLVFLSMRFVGGERWRSALGWSFALAVCSYVVFVVWLKVDLPSGLFWL